MLMHRPLRDEIAQHARPLVRFMAQRIKEQFGLDIQIAFEKEPLVDLGPGNDRARPAMLAARIDHTRQDIEQSIAQRLQRTPVSPMEKFEAELKAGLFEFKTPRTSPSRAVERIDAQTNRAQAFSEYYADHLEDPALPAHMREEAERTLQAIRPFLAQHPVNRVEYKSFSDQPANDPTSAGLHVNFSPWNEGIPLLANTDESLRWYHRLKRRFDEISACDMLMIAPTEDCYRRLERQCKTFEIHAEADKERFEWRTPSVVARHDLAALATLAAIYDSLSHPDERHQAPNMLPPHDVEEAIARFKGRSAVLDWLGDAASTVHSDGMRAHITALRTLLPQAAIQGTLAQPDLKQQMERALDNGRAL